MDSGDGCVNLVLDETGAYGITLGSDAAANRLTVSAGEPSLLGGEDGFAPHASDYEPQDWRIGLSELLRLIQLYNTGAYTTCPDGEDGYCPVI